MSDAKTRIVVKVPVSDVVHWKGADVSENDLENHVQRELDSLCREFGDRLVPGSTDACTPARISDYSPLLGYRYTRDEPLCITEAALCDAA